MKRQVTIWMAAGLLAATATVAAAAGKAPAKVPAKAPAKARPRPEAPIPKLNYQVVNEWKVGGEGAWDSITLDAAGKFLYIPRGTHTQVIDTATGNRVADIGPAHSATAVALAPDANRGFITNSKQGTVTVFDLKTNAVLGEIAVGADPTDILYDPVSKQVLVHCGLSTIVPLPSDIDLKTGKPEPAITIDGEIRGMVTDDHGMVYLSVQDKNLIAVLDTRTMTIATHFYLGEWHKPTAISMDRVHSRLFISCELKLTIVSASDGHILDDIVMKPTVNPWIYTSMTAYDDGHLFDVCGDGAIIIFGQKPNGDFAIEETTKVQPYSRPIAIDHNTGKLYLPTHEVRAQRPVPGTFKILVLQKGRATK